MYGKLIHKLRVNQGISQEELARGICSVTSMSRYEREERVPDLETMNTFIERLGKSPDRLAVTVNTREYYELNWKRSVMAHLERGYWEKAEELLIREKMSRNHLKEQFRLYGYAVLAERGRGDYRRARKLVERALSQTQPERKRPSELLLCQSAMELTLWSYWIYLGMEIDRQNSSIEQYQEDLEALLWYIRERISDERLRVKVFPQTAMLQIDILCKLDAWNYAIWYGETALEEMEKYGRLKGKVQLWLVLAECYEHTGQEQEAECARNKAQKLCQLELEYLGPGDRTGMRGDLRGGCFCQEVYLAGVLFNRNRRARKMSQEDVAGGCHDKCTISRIESGRHYSRKMYHMLEKEMGVETGYLQNEIYTDLFFNLEHQKEIEREIMLGEWKGAEKKLLELKVSLDMKRGQNQQYIRGKEIEFQYQRGELTEQKAIGMIIEAFRDTIPSISKESFRKVWSQMFYTREIRQMCQIAEYTGREGKYKRAIYIMKRAVGYLCERKVDSFFYSDIKCCLLEKLAWLLMENKQYREAAMIVEEGIFFCLHQENGILLEKFLEYQKICQVYN